MTDEKRLRETRMGQNYASYPGKVEFGCLHQTQIGGPMDRVFIESEEEARLDVLELRSRGVKAELVSRTVPAWNTVPTTLLELREHRDAVLAAQEREKQAAIARQEQMERERRELDGDLTWKDL